MSMLVEYLIMPLIIISFMVITIVVFKIYKEYRHKSHKIISLAMMLMFIESVLIELAEFSSNFDLVRIIYIFINILVVITIYLWVTALLLFRYGVYNFKTNLSALLFGFVAALISLGKDITLAYNDVNEYWYTVNPDYSILAFTPLILFVLYETAYPILKIARTDINEEEKKSLYLMGSGLVFIAVWAILSIWNSYFGIIIFRRVILTISFGVWTLGFKRHPFLISITKGAPIKLLVATEDGVLLYGHTFSEIIETIELPQEQIESNEFLTVSLLSAIRSASTELFSDKGDLIKYNLINKTALIHTRNELMFILLATEIDTSLEANLRLFAHLCVQKFIVEKINRFQQTNLSEELDIVFSRVASEMIMN